MNNMSTILVIAIYFFSIIYLTFVGARKAKQIEIEGGSFSEGFYVAGRKIGPVALAILVAAGACSTGTFIGGPGLSAANGIGFMMLFGGGQIPMTLFILGVVGKKINIVGRRTRSESYVDIFRYRYENYAPLIFVLVIAILVFLISSSTGEFVGGSRVLETVTGIPFVYSLIGFGALITVYTSLGGLKGVSIVGILQGFIMTAATLILVVGYMVFYGGMPEIMERVGKLSSDLLTPNVGGKVPLYQLFNLWCTYSIGIIGLPWAVQSALTYKDTRTLKLGIGIGIVFVMIWTVFLCGWAGAAGRLMTPDLVVSDYAIPNLALGTLPGILAGVVLAGVAGAGQSTIAALFILAASSIVVNVYTAFINKAASDREIKRLTILVCTLVGVTNIFLALTEPPTLQVFITFAAGGCAAALAPGLLFGLYWPRTNKYGAFAGVLSGLIFYALFSLVDLGIPFLMNAPLLSAAPLSFLLCYWVSKVTPKPKKETLQIFFGQMKSDA